MLELAPFLETWERQALERDSRFIEANGISSSDFAIVYTEGGYPHTRYVIRYKSFEEVGDFMATMRINTDGTVLEARTRFTDAVLILALIAIDEEFRSLLDKPIPDDEQDALLAVGLDPKIYQRPHVSAYKEGVWLAPHDSRYVLFLVDTYGSVSVLAETVTAGGAAFMLAANLKMDELAVVNQVVAFDPPAITD